MSLLNLRTDLKSLKYGSDRPGGGDSGLPYIKTDINTADSGFNRIRLTKFDDGLIRGGTVGALNASVVDTLRISKFLTDPPKGPLFIAKQVGLQLSNPRLEVPKDPANIILGASDNALSVGTNGLLQPTRIYNLGINTIAQIPVNAFGTHFNRHGVLPVQTDASKYEAVVTANNDYKSSEFNRLVKLANTFEIGDRTPNLITIDRRAIDTFNTAFRLITGISIPPVKINPKDLIIGDYAAGPGSTYGIGRTTINRYSNTEDGYKIKLSLERSTQKSFTGRKRDTTSINYYNILGVSKQYFNNDEEISRETNINENTKTLRTNNGFDRTATTQATTKNILSGSGQSETSNTLSEVSIVNLTNSKNLYSQYRKIIDNKQLTENLKVVSGSIANKFGIYGDKIQSSKGILPTDKDTPVYINEYNDVVKLKLPWNKITRELRIGSGRTDSINLTPIFSETSYWYGDTSPNGKHNIRDLVKFTIQSVNTDEPSKSDFMVFRAYLTNLTDNVDASWNDVKYAGRGNPFYIYNGFTRKMNIGFKVAALSVEEMQPMYSKLNYLMSTLMPDYGKGIVMRGPLHRLTIGNYLDAQLGILNSISYTVPNDSPWEIALDEPEGGTKVLILPHIIEVTMGFTPIGAETGYNLGVLGGTGIALNNIEQKTKNTSFIAQNTTGRDISTIQYYDSFFNK